MIPSKKIIYFSLSFFLILCCTCPIHSRVIYQIMPMVTITESYNDNFFNKNTDEFEEWITSYALGVTLGLLNKNSKIYLKYNPEYKDYKNLNDRDYLDHNVNFIAAFQPTKLTSIDISLNYDGHDGNNDGDSWKHSATLSITNQLTKNINGFLLHDYSKTFEQQVRTGDYKKHQTNTTQLGANYKFGARNSIGFRFIYGFDEYDNSDSDEYKNYEPSANLTYWFTRLDGLESNLEFQKKVFQNISGKDYETISGDIRYIHRFNRHMDGFIKYRQYFSNRKDGNHLIYHPSIDIDWDTNEDSGFSIGIGVLFHDWEHGNDDSRTPFVDLSVYKAFNFSPKGSFFITGNSSYQEAGESAASLGYNMTYQVGCSLDYQFTRRIRSSLFGSFQIQDFDEYSINRRDNTGTIGANLIWNPLKWLVLNLDASHKNFHSTDNRRNNYKTNEISFFIRFIPEKPIQPDNIISKKTLEEKIF